MFDSQLVDCEIYLPRFTMKMFRNQIQRSLIVLECLSIQSKGKRNFYLFFLFRFRAITPFSLLLFYCCRTIQKSVGTNLMAILYQYLHIKICSIKKVRMPTINLWGVWRFLMKTMIEIEHNNNQHDICGWLYLFWHFFLLLPEMINTYIQCCDHDNAKIVRIYYVL